MTAAVARYLTVGRFVYGVGLAFCLQNWIGSEAVKRKRKAGILPRPKFEFTGVSTIAADPN